MINTLTALSPIDGRYAKKTENLRPYFSEYGLIYHRVLVEIRWLQALAAHPLIHEIPPFDQSTQQFLEQIIDGFTVDDAKTIKTIEATTNHDVKAVEYFLKQRFQHHSTLQPLGEFVHFACTSEDINNIAYALILKKSRETIMKLLFNQLLEQLHHFATQYAKQPMLSHTHGQPASPTTVGKEFAVFYTRLHDAYKQCMAVVIRGKCNGATGHFNAHLIAYPKIDWLAFSTTFITDLGLDHSAYTTQIEPHDYIAQLAHAVMRFNTILIDLNRDMWGYIALNYFQQRRLDQETGSSTMPHKINPIDFENSEGNLMLAHALLHCFATQLPTSRWQRDLVDSTLLRNLGVAISHSSIAYQATLNGLNKLLINKTALDHDLDQHWEILAEALQTVMRRYHLPEPYEQLKAFTRGQSPITKDQLHQFIDQLALPNDVKQTLKTLTPSTYCGLAKELALNI